MEVSMAEDNSIIIAEDKNIQNMIYTFRGKQVMVDSDLAKLYQVETRVFNQAVKRNLNRFPEYFRFQLTEEEFKNLRSQIVISSESNTHGGRRYMPYVFTEQGIAMLSTVLKSKVATDVSINIMPTINASSNDAASKCIKRSIIAIPMPCGVYSFPVRQ